MLLEVKFVGQHAEGKCKAFKKQINLQNKCCKRVGFSTESTSPKMYK